jgi:hypothetical protein
MKTAVMARRRRRRRPGGHTTAVGSGGRRAPFSTDTASHTHTVHSLACPLLTLSSARPFSNGIFRSNGAPASLPPASSSLTHARRMDGFCNQNAEQLGSLAGQSLLTVYVGLVVCAHASPPQSSSLTHARRMDGFCNQNAEQLGYLAGLSLLTVYVGVVECAPASPCTYSSSSDWRTVFKEFASQSLHNRFFFKKKIRPSKRQRIFPLFFLLHKRAKPILPPYCNVTESVILSDRYRGVTVRSMMSSVPHEIAAHEPGSGSVSSQVVARVSAVGQQSVEPAS